MGGKGKSPHWGVIFTIRLSSVWNGFEIIICTSVNEQHGGYNGRDYGSLD